MRNSSRFKVQSSIVHCSLFIVYCLLLFSCQQNYTPKPHTYYRIDFPEKEYRMYDDNCPFTFEYPVYGTLVPDTRPSSEPCWMNINFPKYKGTIYLTYMAIDDNKIFDQLIENEWNMVYSKIAQKASAVNERLYNNPEENVYGMMYNIEGNAASQALFFVTDSVRNWLRGSLYFNARPNHDSLAPVVVFFREDIIALMETVRWKETKTKK